jgi:hypothetical protein
LGSPRTAGEEEQEQEVTRKRRRNSDAGRER